MLCAALVNPHPPNLIRSVTVVAPARGSGAIAGLCGAKKKVCSSKEVILLLFFFNIFIIFFFCSSKHVPYPSEVPSTYCHCYSYIINK